MEFEEMNGKSLNVEVIGVDPPCARCRKTEENARKAAAKLEEEGYRIKVEKLSITAKETIAKYGVLMSPAIAVNGTVKIMGKVLDVGVIERLLRQEV
jgi:hypothetical protein